MKDLQQLTFRHPNVDDAQAVIELMSRCEVAEYGESDSDIEDLLYDWGTLDLEQDAQLAFTPDGQLAGYAAVMPWTADVRYDFFADPQWPTDELGQRMLAFCLQRGPAFAQAHDFGPQAKLTLYIAHSNQRNRAAVTAAGFQAVRFHFQMEIELDAPLGEPAWPEGLTIRNVSAEQDAQQVHALIEAAFARPERTPTTLEDWQGFMLRADIFDPHLWYLALDGDRLVGACLCFAYPELGWVRQLAVDKNWRRKGLGSALLRHAFNQFKQSGYSKAGLTVAGENKNAYQLYQKAGMHRLRQYDQYEKTLSA